MFLRKLKVTYKVFPYSPCVSVFINGLLAQFEKKMTRINDVTKYGNMEILCNLTSQKHIFAHKTNK